MTGTEIAASACPNCGSSSTALGASGAAMCTDCAHRWDPANPTAATAPIVAPFAMAPVNDVFGTADIHNPESYQDRMDALIGGQATLEGGQVVEVVSFVGTEKMIGRDRLGDLIEVPMSDVERIVEPVADVVPVDVPETVDDIPADMRLSLDLAKLIVRAGIETVNGTGEAVTPGVPPVGYLPADPDLHLVIERAAALAVALLIDLYSLDVDPLLIAVGAVTEEPEEGDTTTEETE